MNVLVVEDEDPKLNALIAFISEKFNHWKVTTARSVRTAREEISAVVPDLLLLDMSLPTFDIVEGEPGGRPQGFGGIEVLRYLEMLELPIPVLVITGYEGFTKEGKSIDLSTLSEELSKDFPENFRGAVQFNTVSGEWVSELVELIEINKRNKL